MSTTRAVHARNQLIDALKPSTLAERVKVEVGVMGAICGRLFGALMVVTVIAACGSESTQSADAGSGQSDSPGTPSSEVSESPTESPVFCPHPLGGRCLGDLEGGRLYRTVAFIPPITYTTPSGWSNLEDLSGNFLLLPPGRSVEGVDSATDDYLGVYSGATVAAADCTSKPMPGVGLKPDAVVTALAERPGLNVSAPREVVVGGLKGVVIAIDLEPDTTAACNVNGDLTIIPLFIGVGPASVEHAQVPGLRTHLYVLDNGRSNVIVEVSDVGRDKRLFDYERVIEKLRFSPT